MSMAAARYGEWQRGIARLGRGAVPVATKPGLAGHPEGDTAALMLADAIDIAPGDRVLVLNAGSGLVAGVACVAAGKSGAVDACERNLIAVRSTERTRALLAQLQAQREAHAPAEAQLQADSQVDGHARSQAPVDGRARSPAQIQLTAAHADDVPPRPALGDQLAPLTVAHTLSPRAAMADVGNVDVVAIRTPTDKPSLVVLLAAAGQLLRSGGRCYLAGANNEGIKSAASLMEEHVGPCRVIANRQGHRVLAATASARAFAAPEGAGVSRGSSGSGESSDRITASASSSPAVSESLSSSTLASRATVDTDATHIIHVDIRGHQFRAYTRPGVFSCDGLDEGTAALIQSMRLSAGDRVLDLGCGSGVAGTVAGLLGGRPILLDVDAEAVRCAMLTLQSAGVTGEVLASDVAGALHDAHVEVVITNPPFHLGRATALDVPRQFIADSWRVLRPGGQLFLVANRTLPYERMIDEQFGNVGTAYDGPRFKVLVARKARLAPSH